MKHTIEIWRAKVRTQDKCFAHNTEFTDNKQKRGRHFESCVDDMAQTKRPKPLRMNYKKGKTPSLGTITTSASTNCCTCCSLLAEYIRQVLKLILLCPGNTKVTQVFCDMLEVGGCLCNDCYYFLKKLLSYLCNIKK